MARWAVAKSGSSIPQDSDGESTTLGDLVEAASYHGGLPAELARWPEGHPSVDERYRRVFAHEIPLMSDLGFAMQASRRAQQPNFWADLAAKAAAMREPAPCLACLRALRHGLESGS